MALKVFRYYAMENSCINISILVTEMKAIFVIHIHMS